MPGVPKVRAWANTVRRHQLRLADVDLYVLRDQPEILQALGRPRAADDAPGPGPGAARRGGREQVGAVLAGITMLAPVLAMVAFGGPVPGNSAIVAEPMDDELALGWTTAWFLLAAAGPVLLARRWWLSHRHRDRLDLAALVAAAGCAALVLRARPGWGAGPISLTAFPVWATGVGAVLVLLAQLAGSRGWRTPADLHFPRTAPADLRRAGELVAALPPAVQDQLHGMRGRALDTLVRRGLVGPDQREALADVALGQPPRAPGRRGG